MQKLASQRTVLRLLQERVIVDGVGTPTAYMYSYSSMHEARRRPMSAAPAGTAAQAGHEQRPAWRHKADALI
jgi:hypothetical protein